jgi:hypothetical protein
VECGVDRAGYDMSDSPVYPGSFESCVAACAGRTGCQQVSYVYMGPCYLKSGQGAPGQNGGIIGGRLLTPASSVTASATSAPATSTTIETVIVSATPTESPSGSAGLTCPAADGEVYVSECGATYAIECASDR